MYGYLVTAIRVTRKGADDAPLLIDNLDGRGASFEAAWRDFFAGIRSDRQTRARRYWQSAPAQPLLPALALAGVS